MKKGILIFILAVSASVFGKENLNNVKIVTSSNVVTSNFSTTDSSFEKDRKDIMDLYEKFLKNEDKATLEERARGFILISAKKDNTTPDSRLFFDVGIASQNIILIADELGYGACIVMSYNKKAFEEILDLPEDYDSKAVIILGEAKDIVKLVDSKDEEDTKYFIENGIHHVPKLKLGDLILAKK